MISDLIKEYINPVKIVAASDNVKNAECLLTNKNTQVFFKEKAFLSCKGKGYIILDFGKELHGGARILSYYLEGQKTLLSARLRFGESVGETCAELGEKNATNDHSVRDMPIYIPDLSDQEWGRTGFRFLRIDFLDENKEYRLTNVYAFSTYRNEKFIGEFSCSDERVNKIYETARYTLFVNMQENLWEGIKRDRLVWIGDMQPEVLAITDLFGSHPLAEKAIEDSVEKNPLPCWFGNIPTYSAWLIQIVGDYYMKTGNAVFFKKFVPYIDGILKQLDGVVEENGDIDYSLIPVDARNGFFLDWPSNGTCDAKEGNRAVFIVALRSYLSVCKEAGITPDPTCEKVLVKLKKAEKNDVNLKQIVALSYLAGRIEKNSAAEKLTNGGAKGLSTFMSYFILRALAESSGIDKAVEIMKDYYGGMLDRGATSFWEDFNVEWLEGSGRIDEITPEGLKDLHGDHGAFCYKGFRHSHCHGWSCGPVQFLIEKVLGIEVLSAGCKKIKINPELGDLEYAKGKFPTPYGIVEINARKENGKTVVSVYAPKETEIISEYGNITEY